jgi:hypothetical protein
MPGERSTDHCRPHESPGTGDILDRLRWDTDPLSSLLYYNVYLIETAFSAKVAGIHVSCWHTADPRIRFAMPSGIKKASRLRLLRRLSPTCHRASFIFPCQAVTERHRQKGFATGRACTAIAFVFRKACSRPCRSSFALGSRPLSRYFCK